MPAAPAEAEAAFQLLDSIMRNPDTRGDALKLIKKHNPKVVIPEIDAAAPFDAKMAAMEKKLDDALKGMTEREQDGKLIGEFTSLRTKRGYTDEGMEKIKKLMVEKAIADPVVAADHFDATQPKNDPSLPVGYSPSTFLDTDDKSLEPWFQNEDRAADQEIVNILREVRAGSL